MAADGCWVKIYVDTNFNDNSLTIHGPAEFSTMRDLEDIDGYKWGDQIASIRTGPNCWVIAYADKDFQDTLIIIGPDSELADLGDMENEIFSMEILANSP